MTPGGGGWPEGRGRDEFGNEFGWAKRVWRARGTAKKKRKLQALAEQMKLNRKTTLMQRIIAAAQNTPNLGCASAFRPGNDEN